METYYQKISLKIKQTVLNKFSIFLYFDSKLKRVAESRMYSPAIEGGISNSLLVVPFTFTVQALMPGIPGTPFVPGFPGRPRGPVSPGRSSTRISELTRYRLLSALRPEEIVSADSPQMYGTQ
jgi:hypothetical protein